MIQLVLERITLWSRGPKLDKRNQIRILLLGLWGCSRQLLRLASLDDKGLALEFRGSLLVYEATELANGAERGAGARVGVE